jgi:hypothetical protein
MKKEKRVLKKQKSFSKKTVVVLVIIAICLASFAVAYNYFDLNKKIPTNVKGDLKDSSGGVVGIQILPPEIEDKGIK